MPFTPFHFGPGALAKSVLRRHFSFALFVFTQIIVDCEPFYFLLTNDPPVHRFFHTYLGANVIVLIGFFAGRPLIERLFKIRMTAAAALLSSAIGAYSHVVFDSLMHPDMRPLSPFSEANPLLGAVDLGMLHGACLAAGAIGLALFWMRRKAGNS